MSKITKRDVIKAVIITILLFSSYFLYLYFKECYTKVLFIIVVAIYSWFLIPDIFFHVLSSEKNEYCHYHCLHLLYIVLPIGLIFQVILINEIWLMVVIIQIISIGNIFRLHSRCKPLIKKHLKYLRYSNMLISGIFSFLLSLLCLYKDTLNVVFMFLFLLPFFCLQVLYERIGISAEDEDGTQE
jgi:hypothetical protein